MARETTTVNARIRSTMLGPDHGVLTFYLILEWNGAGCGFGGLCAKGPGLGAAIERILTVVGVDKWESLAGKLVRAESEGIGGGIVSISHIMDEKSVTLKELGELIKGAP